MHVGDAFSPEDTASYRPLPEFERAVADVAGHRQGELRVRQLRGLFS